jgi:anti-sigma factor RsiW
MNCNVAVVWIHDYLDDDLPRGDIGKLKEHLLVCENCRARFKQLEQTEAYAQAAMHEEISAASVSKGYSSGALKYRIMKQLPAKRRSQTWTRWVRNHPAVAVAAVFALVMMSSFFTMWKQDTELVVRGADLGHVVIEGHTVTIPEGTQYNGDLTVENGKTEVYGKVNGNLTVIDGSVNLASTAKIVGEERTINQALDWIWYKVTRTVSDLAS